MNEQRFTVHINFVNSKRFVEKSKNRTSGLYLDFIYLEDYYKSLASNNIGDRKYLLLATLYASNKSLMENFRSSRVISSTSIYNRGFNIVSDNLLINKSNFGLAYNYKDDDITYMPYNPSQHGYTHIINDELLIWLASHNLLM